MTETPRETGPDIPGVTPQPGDRPSGRPVSPAPGYGPDGTNTDGTNTRAPAGGTEPAAGRGGTVDTPPPAGQPGPRGAAGPEHHKVTRAGMVWAAVASALVVLILLIAFILQNQDYVRVRFFGLEGAVSLGVALLIAAVGGGVLVAIAGAARIIQLRLAAHRQRVKTAGRR
ncbi:LapA family protein [Pseudarthrobacter sp. H2]|uniref:LapA family protein n=1 Tax=Pseudarthrobacter sp. H2 TaxID=3418415 RepID=UPI003CEB90FE